MKKTEKIELTKEEEDIIKMVGNVGGGNAAIALSKLTGANISLEVVSASLTNVEKLSRSIESLNEPFTMSYSPLSGTLIGNIVVMMPTTSACLLVDRVEKKKARTTKILDETQNSMVGETFNIVGNAYLTALNDFMGITLFPFIAKIVTVSRAEGIDSVVKGGVSTLVLGDFGEKPRYVLVINTSLKTGQKLACSKGQLPAIGTGDYQSTQQFLSGPGGPRQRNYSDNLLQRNLK